MEIFPKNEEEQMNAKSCFKWPWKDFIQNT